MKRRVVENTLQAFIFLSQCFSHLLHILNSILVVFFMMCTGLLYNKNSFLSYLLSVIVAKLHHGVNIINVFVYFLLIFYLFTLCLYFVCVLTQMSLKFLYLIYRYIFPYIYVSVRNIYTYTYMIQSSITL